MTLKGWMSVRLLTNWAEGDFTPDLSKVGDRRAQTGFPRAVVGFAAESDSVEENARAKLVAKELDLIVANDITDSDSGFGADNNRVTIINREGKIDSLPLLSKRRVADVILDRVVALLRSKARRD